uniref:Uncharacterized protein n=1 Tax=Arundo donax TaxID=35708 RepID=A0A0A9AYH4_ARUDO
MHYLKDSATTCITLKTHKNSEHNGYQAYDLHHLQICLLPSSGQKNS